MRISDWSSDVCSSDLWRGHVETGLAAVASVADYESNRIRKHEFTTVAKEDDRVRQTEAVNAQNGPVMLAYPAGPDIDGLLRSEERHGGQEWDSTCITWWEQYN